MPSYARYPAKDQRFASLSIYKPKKTSSSLLVFYLILLIIIH